ncbi:PEP-CTERM sorting domain-containing protein [Undibacterium sp. Xuan67W]|uniref:PEP-CTERM sorting domain-containing protein n=1 Tax=Undibacterium sp. Xuan67W TaxID=3413057 RepID=UPI003BF44B17
MKKTVLALGLALMTAGSAYATGFTNGGFESGNLSGWTGGGGTWTGSPAAPANPSIFNGGPSNNTIMTGGVDPITGANRVYSGNYSVRANDNISNYSVSTLRQTVTNYTDNAIYFAWDAVLQGSHGLTDSDYFSLTLTDDTTHTTIVNRAYSSAGAIGGGASGVTWTSFGGWLSSGWIVESINLADLNAIGHDFTLTLLASDCPYGGHAGYVYLDGFGARIPPTDVPEPGSLALLGLGIAGLASLRKRKNAA